MENIGKHQQWFILPRNCLRIQLWFNQNIWSSIKKVPMTAPSRGSPRCYMHLWCRFFMILHLSVSCISETGPIKWKPPLYKHPKIRLAGKNLLKISANRVLRWLHQLQLILDPAFTKPTFWAWKLLVRGYREFLSRLTCGEDFLNFSVDFRYFDRL